MALLALSGLFAAGQLAHAAWTTHAGGPAGDVNAVTVNTNNGHIIAGGSFAGKCAEWSDPPPPTVSPSSGPFAGGNRVVFTNASANIGNGTDITNITVGGVAATDFAAQGTNWVTFIAPATGSAGAKDIVIQSTLVGATTLPDAYTVNPAGRIGRFLPMSTNLISAGGSHSLGLKSDGTVVAWGSDLYGQATVPAPNTNFVAVGGGRYHSLGLKSDSSIVGWGYNRSGQTTVPAPNTNFLAVAGGERHSLGLKSDSSIVAWGLNGSGQTTVPTPNTNFLAVAGGYLHSLGLKSDGSIVGWGSDLDGQATVPAPNTNFVAVAAGLYHSLGLKSDSSIVGWGDNSSGQTTVPAPNTNFLAVAAGGCHSLGLKSDGTIVAWGDNASGQTNVPAPNMDFGVWGDGVSPSYGSWTGGYPVVICGENLGNGSDVTNVMLCGISATIQPGQSATQVVVVAGASSSELVGAVRVYSVSYGETVKSNAFSYTVPGLQVLGTNGATISSGEAVLTEKGTDFGSISWSAVLTNTFSITNSGNESLTISGWTTNGAGSPHFQVAGMPGAVAIGAKSNFNIIFAPAAAGAHTTAVVVANNSTNLSYVVYMIGTGLKHDQTITNFTPTNGSAFATTGTVGLASQAGSGLAVSFTVGSGPGSITGDTNLSFSATGTVSIVASQAGDTNWNAAPDVTNTFSVTCEEPPTPSQTGTLSISVTVATGTWTLGGPTNYSGVTSGTGSLANTNVPTGIYSVAYGFLAGYRTPSAQTQEVTGRASVAFTGEYILHQTPLDFGGEGCSDIVVYNPINGQWYIWSPESGLIAWEATLGGQGYDPVPGDYDGDGRSDLGVYNAGYWYAQSLDGTYILNGEAFGGSEFLPVAGDYDGDGTTDLTVYHKGTGYWYSRTVDGSLLLWGERWGGPGFDAVAGDYNKDGQTDLAVYSAGYWYVRTVDGSELTFGQSWGGTEFAPVSGDYDGDGIADLAVYHEGSGYWFIITLAGNVILWGERWGGPGFTAVQGDYNADGISDLAVYYNGYWFIETVDGTLILYGGSWGGEGYDPVGR